MDVTTTETAAETPVRTGTSQSIDWYSEGQARTVEVGEIQVTVKLVGRKGRRARISVTAPAGAAFRGDGVETGR